MDLKDVIKGPIITEKSTQATVMGKYSFKVDPRADKKEIAKAVENFFKVHVRQVRTMIVRGKQRKLARSRRQIKLSNWKKSTVQLAEGEKINIFETGE